MGFLELAAGVGVCDTVLVLVGPRLSFDRSVVHRGGIRGWCMSYHWRSVHHRGGVHQRRMVHWRVVDWSMVDRSSSLGLSVDCDSCSCQDLKRSDCRPGQGHHMCHGKMIMCFQWLL